jgi:hypothetical protein
MNTIAPAAAPRTLDVDIRHRDTKRPDGVEVAIRYGEAKSRQDVPAALACCTDDFVMEAVGLGTRAAGRAEVEYDLGIFFALFPDYRFVLIGATDGPDSVVLFGRIEATFSGRVPPAIAALWPRLIRLPRRRVAIPAVAVLMMRDGLIARERFHFDLHELSRQIGVPARLVASLARRAERARYVATGAGDAIRTERSAVINAPIQEVYDRAFADVSQIARCSPRWPVRAERITLGEATALQTGAVRRVHLSNGHVMDERIECTAPKSIKYVITNGFGRPLDALLKAAWGEHELEALPGDRTLVTWRAFVLPRKGGRTLARVMTSRVLAPMLERWHRQIPDILRGNEAKPACPPAGES